MSPEYISNPEEAKEFLPRYRLFYIVIAVTMVLYLSRLWYLQIFKGDELRDASENNRVKQIRIMAPRGLVFDRNGKVLVENHPGLEAVLSPQYIKDLEKAAQGIGEKLGIDPLKIVQKVQRSRRTEGPFIPVEIKKNLNLEEVTRLMRILLDTPGLEIRETVVRHYPLGPNGAQLFGYLGEITKKQLPTYNKLYLGQIKFQQGDIIGKTGLEEILEKDIRGASGVQFLQVDAFGREATLQTDIYGEGLRDVEPKPGMNIVLTIDKDIQEASYKSFVENQRSGALVVMKSNGEILSWISSPSFNPNDFAQGISPQVLSGLVNDKLKPLRNKVIQDHFSPGSTFKPFMALASLEEKIISPTTVIYCPGAFAFGRRLYHDHLKGGHGNITVYEALERSSNVFFYKMGIQLGIDKMHAYVSSLGIGAKTQVDIPRETTGLMPSAQWKKSAVGEEWQPGENLSVAIGQGFVQTNPLQMAVAYNAIGLGGKVFRPFVIKKILDTDGKVVRENSETLVRDLTKLQPNGIKISPETFRVVKEGMRRVVQGDRGTARSIRLPGVEMAGKTGTAQVMGFSADQIYAKCENRPIHQRHHGWLIAWAPAENPEITVAALAEHSCHGITGAGPMVKAAMKTYFDKYHPELMAEAQAKIIEKTGHIEIEVPEGE